MGRPFFPYESDDQDLDWLLSNFLYERPDFLPIEAGMLPIVLIPHNECGVRISSSNEKSTSEVTPSGEEPEMLKMPSLTNQK